MSTRGLIDRAGLNKERVSVLPPPRVRTWRKRAHANMSDSSANRQIREKPPQELHHRARDRGGFKPPGRPRLVTDYHSLEFSVEDPTHSKKMGSDTQKIEKKWGPTGSAVKIMGRG